MQKITPFLWFNDTAEEAATFYLSIFKNSKITSTHRHGNSGPAKPGSVMTIAFELEGQSFIALNGGPHFKLTPAISFLVDCHSQPEVDHYWDALLAGGTPQQCGWLTDKFGITWQIIPRTLMTLLKDPNPKKSAAVMRAMMQMVKLDIPTLQNAYDNS